MVKAYPACISAQKGQFSPPLRHFFPPMLGIDSKKWLDGTKIACFFVSKPLG
jgi:hypothetical protein